MVWCGGEVEYYHPFFVARQEPAFVQKKGRCGLWVRKALPENEDCLFIAWMRWLGGSWIGLREGASLCVVRVVCGGILVRCFEILGMNGVCWLSAVS